MKIRFFEGCSTCEDVKQRYYELVKRYHPDRPENGEAEQEILKVVNNEYETAFKKLKSTFRNAEGAAYTKASTETPEEFKSIINQIVHLYGVNIEICGSWIWVSKNTRIYKDTLKALHFKWSPKKVAWHWHSGAYKKWGRHEFSLDEIRLKYGSSNIKTEPAAKLNQNPKMGAYTNE